MTDVGTRFPPEPRVVPFSDHLALLDERRRLWERIARADAEIVRLRETLDGITAVRRNGFYSTAEEMRRMARKALS